MLLKAQRGPTAVRLLTAYILIYIYIYNWLRKWNFYSKQFLSPHHHRTVISWIIKHWEHLNESWGEISLCTYITALRAQESQTLSFKKASRKPFWGHDKNTPPVPGDRIRCNLFWAKIAQECLKKTKQNKEQTGKRAVESFILWPFSLRQRSVVIRGFRDPDEFLQEVWKWRRRLDPGKEGL